MGCPVPRNRPMNDFDDPPSPFGPGASHFRRGRHVTIPFPSPAFTISQVFTLAFGYPLLFPQIKLPVTNRRPDGRPLDRGAARRLISCYSLLLPVSVLPLKHRAALWTIITYIHLSQHSHSTRCCHCPCPCLWGVQLDFAYLTSVTNPPSSWSIDLDHRRLILRVLIGREHSP
jgi:hypothetical protein